jgi:tetratricopeptide (TPR) repeat protein
MKLTVAFLFLCLQIISFGQSDYDHINKALELINKGKIEEGFKIIGDDMRERPELAENYLFLADVLVAYNQNREAVTILTDGIKAVEDHRLYNSRGLAYQNLKKFDLSVMDFTSAVNRTDVDSTKYGYIVNRSTSKFSKRDFQGSYDDLLLAYNYDSTDIAVLVNLGNTVSELGETDKAVTYFKKAIDVDPKFAGSYINLGFYLQINNRHVEALPYFNKAIELDPNQGVFYNNRSFSLLKTGDIKGALSDVEKSIKLDPSNAYAFKNRALINIERGKMKTVCDDLYEARKLKYEEMYGSEVEELILKYCK